MEIKNKAVLVTGASEGIGLAAARYLGRAGAKVALVARSAEKLAAAARDIPGSLAVAADLRQPAGVKKAVAETLQKFGRIDILINNAGQGIYGPVEKTDLDQYRAVMELNLFAPVALMQAVIPIMRRQGGGLILNVSSMVSKRYIPGLAAYASTKYALNAISFTAREELSPDKIIVSSMFPKMTATRFGVNAVNARTDARAAGQAAPGVDTPEQVAEKIGDLIRSEDAEAAM